MKTVLVVDDNEDFLRVMEKVLRSTEYEMSRATGGQAALELIATTVPDLVLLDIMMPGLDGFQTLLKLREDPRTEDVPVIIVSARDDKEAILTGLRMGASDYLSKPADRNEILSRIEIRLALAERRRETVKRIAQDLLGSDTDPMQARPGPGSGEA